jgi:hypothetical protein
MGGGKSLKRSGMAHEARAPKQQNDSGALTFTA